MRTQAGAGYRPELDGIRGLSILLVLNQHFRIPRWEPGSFVGVDVFFVLSGYLITSLLLKEWDATGRLNFPQFYLRRALRLLPAAAAFIVVALVTARLVSSPQAFSFNLTGARFTALYITNWVLALSPDLQVGDFAITWSLAIEEQFYLLWPLLMMTMLGARWSRRRIGVALVGAVAVVFAVRLILWRQGAPSARLYYGSDTRADALLVGCLAAVSMPAIARRAAQAHWLRTSLRTAAAVAALLLAWVVHTKDSTAPFLYLGGFTLVALCAGILLVTTTVAAPPALLAVLRFRPLVWIGRISYGLYLWHWLVYRHADHLSSSPLRASVLGALLSVAVAACSYVALEAPFLRLKGRLRSATARVGSPAPPAPAGSADR
jgi:peptidoglycan/LPS O-acetylase OafA/YrhL